LLFDKKIGESISVQDRDLNVMYAHGSAQLRQFWCGALRTLTDF
jgi:hypothetical protein